MDYRKDSDQHILSFDKDEIIFLIALVHSGLDRLKSSSLSGGAIEKAKYESCRMLVESINRKIMSY